MTFHLMRFHINLQKIEVDRAVLAAQQMPNQLMNIVFSPKHGDRPFNDIHGSFSPPISNVSSFTKEGVYYFFYFKLKEFVRVIFSSCTQSSLIANGLPNPALLSGSNSGSTVGNDNSQCHRLEALCKYREKRKQRTFERKVSFSD